MGILVSKRELICKSDAVECDVLCSCVILNPIDTEIWLNGIETWAWNVVIYVKFNSVTSENQLQ